MDGILIIDKPQSITSRDVVNKAVKILNTKKIGHTGTLDPLATGVLVLCVGEATKLVDVLTSHDKTYIASVELGTLTDTLDSTGNIINDIKCIKAKEEIEYALNSFIGTYTQEVPIYSAVKVNGKKLYEYARENISVELPKRDVIIHSINLIGDVEYKNNKTIFNFECNVSKGTYIRALIKDIALKLNTVGIMINLRRIKLGKFDIKESIKIEDISSDKLINIIDVLEYKKVILDSSIEKKVLNGAPINNIYNTDVLFIKDGCALAIYKIDDKDNSKLKPYKMFKGGR